VRSGGLAVASAPATELSGFAMTSPRGRSGAISPTAGGDRVTSAAPWSTSRSRAER